MRLKLNDQEELLTPAEIAKILRVSTRAVHKWLRSGKLRGVKLGPAKAALWRIPRKSLEEFVRKKDGD
ncbi:MAG TPA: helix-turn-helix domain-containing protein [Clostridia bacterium]|nr:helix-turn-helix domain-containing protein [Clostridia bacterium]